MVTKKAHFLLRKRQNFSTAEGFAPTPHYTSGSLGLRTQTLDSDPLQEQTLNSLLEKMLSAPRQNKYFKRKLPYFAIKSISQNSVLLELPLWVCSTPHHLF